MDQKKTGSLILKLRKEKNMTQKELAQQLNVTDKAVSKWERGLSYPDTELLLKLSGIFGITVNELLEGERSSMPKKEKAPDDNTDSIKKTKAKPTYMIPLIYSAAMLLGIIVCTICNTAINGRLTWGLYPIVSIGFAWAFTIPVVCRGKRGIIWSLAVLTLLIIPFLFALDMMIGGNTLIMPIGTGSAVMSLIYLWCVLFIWRRFGKRKLLAAGMTVMATLPLNIAINVLVSRIIAEPVTDVWDMISYGLILVISAVLLCRDKALSGKENSVDNNADNC